MLQFDILQLHPDMLKELRESFVSVFKDNVPKETNGF